MADYLDEFAAEPDEGVEWRPTYTVRLIVMDHEAGAWCSRCNLPSGFRVTYALGLRLETFTRCVECCEPIP